VRGVRFAHQFTSKRAPSSGWAETLVSQLAAASHYFMKPEERQEAGISDSLIRLSLGTEDAEDIISDLEQAFDKT